MAKRPTKISLADRIIEAWANGESETFYLAPYYKPVKFLITNKECKDLSTYGVSESQCAVLQEVFGGEFADGIFSEAKAEKLEKAGFSKDLIKELWGNDGYKPLHVATKWLAEDAVKHLKGWKQANVERCDDLKKENRLFLLECSATEDLPRLMKAGDLALNLTDASKALMSVLKDGNIPSYLRSYVLETIGVIDATEITVKTLVDALKDSDPKLRASAARGLGFMARRLRQLRTSRDVNINRRSEAEDALIKMENTVAPALVQAYSMQDKPFVRYAVTKALTMLASNNTIEGLINASGDSDLDIREHAIRALGGIGPDAGAAIPRLGEVIKTTSSPWIYCLAIDAIGSIAAPEGFSILEDVLTERDKDGRLKYSGEARLKAVLALNNIKVELSVSVLMNVVSGDPDIEVRLAAINTLGEYKKAEAVPMLIGIVRKTVSKTEGRVSSLKRALNEQNPYEACRGNEDVIDCYYQRTTTARTGHALFRELYDEDRRLAAASIRALGKIGSQSAVSDLIELLDGDAKLVRRAAAEALGDYGPLAGYEAELKLIKISKDGDEDDVMRAAATWALKQIRP